MQFDYSKNKHIIFSFLFLLIAILICIFLYIETNNLQEKIAVSNEKWQNENIKRNNAQALAEFLEKVKDKKDSLESHFVRSSDIVPVLGTIENLALRTGSIMEVISVNLSKDGNYLELMLKAEGNFESLYKFMLLLENSPYQVSISNFGLLLSNAEPEKGKLPMWTANLSISLSGLLSE